MPPRTTDAQRRAEVEALAGKLSEAVTAAIQADTREAWAEVATYAGNVQRRARLLAGLGRGG